MHRLRTILLEDDTVVRNFLFQQLAAFPELQMVGSAASVDEAFRLIASEKPAAAFMDIKLIGGNAFQLIGRLRSSGVPVPQTVLVTAYFEYADLAINDYREYVVQYLMKPLADDELSARLRKSIDALLGAAFPPVSSTRRNYLFVQTRGVIQRLDFDQIAYFEAAGSGESYVVTDQETLQIDLTLARLEELLPSEQFFRISRVNVINLDRLVRITREDRTAEIQLPGRARALTVGDAYYPDLLAALPLMRRADG